MHSVTKGKHSELYVMAILLENGFKVFQTLADTEGIDCIVQDEGTKFYPIQIKSRADFIGGNIVSISQFADDMFHNYLRYANEKVLDNSLRCVSDAVKEAIPEGRNTKLSP